MGRMQPGTKASPCRPSTSPKHHSRSGEQWPNPDPPNPTNLAPQAGAQGARPRCGGGMRDPPDARRGAPPGRAEPGGAARRVPHRRRARVHRQDQRVPRRQLGQKQGVLESPCIQPVHGQEGRKSKLCHAGGRSARVGRAGAQVPGQVRGRPGAEARVDSAASCCCSGCFQAPCAHDVLRTSMRTAAFPVLAPPPEARPSSTSRGQATRATWRPRSRRPQQQRLRQRRPQRPQQRWVQQRTRQ